jgi:competence ComEA-like helix-hairpin-helix protein
MKASRTNLRARIPVVAAAVLLCVGLLAVGACAQKTPPARPVDLNTATAEQLQQLPGVGPATAKAIIQFREKSGPFRRVEDLLAIRRITKKRLEEIRPYVTVGSVPPAKKKPT